jgi:hypothetical protein
MTMTAEARAAEVVEQITPREREAFGAYWHALTQLDFVKAPVLEVAEIYGYPYALRVVERNRRAMDLWAGALEGLHAALYERGRVVPPGYRPSVEAWIQGRQEEEHYRECRAAIEHQAEALKRREADTEAANAHPHPNH